MKIINRIAFMTLLIITSALFFSCDDDSDTPVPSPVPTPSLSPIIASFTDNTVDVAFGNTYMQTVTTNCPDADIAYSSSDQSVATVNPSTGEVTTRAKGSTTITATVKAPKDSDKYEGTISVSYQINVYYNALGTIKIGFRSSFSPDLLELVTPIVSYRDKDGEHEVRLDKATCNFIKNEYDLGDEVFVYEAYSWAPSIECNIYENIDFDETVSVRFESNKKNIEENRKYNLSASAGIRTVDHSFSYNGTWYTGTYTSISLDININIGDGETHDDDIYEGESVQKYIDEIVQTKQDFRIEVSKDGKVKVNGK